MPPCSPLRAACSRFKKAPDFEDAKDERTDTDNMYEVTVQATDSTNKLGMTKEVTSKVTNVEEPGKVTLSALRPQSATALTASHDRP